MENKNYKTWGTVLLATIVGGQILTFLPPYDKKIEENPHIVENDHIVTSTSTSFYNYLTGTGTVSVVLTTTPYVNISNIKI